MCARRYISLNKKRSAKSLCIDQFLKKGCPLDDADPYVVLSLIIDEFDTFSSNFRNTSQYLTHTSEKLYKVSSLKNIRDTISHMGCSNSKDASFAPKKLPRTRILQTLCSIGELAFEMRSDDLREYVDQKISSLYPHQLIKLKFRKQVDEMLEQDKQNFWNLMDSAKEMGYHTISIEFGSIIVSFYSFHCHCSADQLLKHFHTLEAKPHLLHMNTKITRISTNQVFLPQTKTANRSKTTSFPQNLNQS